MKIKITDADPSRHNHIQYPMEIGGQKFEPVKIEQEKDLMLSVANMNAKQEYKRIMESAEVLRKQANQLMRRLELTNLIHSAKFGFKPIPGRNYWLYKNHGNKFVPEHHGLSPMGPDDWGSGPPKEYEYIAQVTCLGDQTWVEVELPSQLSGLEHNATDVGVGGSSPSEGASF